MTFQISQRGNSTDFAPLPKPRLTERLRVSLRPLPTTTSVELRKLGMCCGKSISLDRLLTLTDVWSEYGRSYSICPKV